MSSTRTRRNKNHSKLNQNKMQMNAEFQNKINKKMNN